MRARNRGGVRRGIAVLVGCLLVFLLAASRAGAVGLQSIGPSFSRPIFATSPPGDPRLFVVERGGTIQVLHDGTETQFLDIHTLVDSAGGTERGLLSMAFDPHYATNGLFYVFYNDSGSAGGADGDVRIEQFHVSPNPNVADASSRRTVWTFPHGATNHNGGQLQFGPDGYLYITVGDNATSSNAQSLSNPYGKIFRIDPHGAGNGAHGVPAGNPFPGAPVPEIWGYGLRNPFRFSFDALNGDLVIADVGASSREEVDLSPAAGGGGRGANYGWPNCEGFLGTCPGATPPVFDYPHSNPGGDAAYGCAIIGGYVYRGTQAPEIAGRYLYTDNCTGELRSIQLGFPRASGDRPESAPGALGSPESFGEDSACNLYVMNTTTVYRIVGSASSVAPACPRQPVRRKCRKRRHHKKHHAAAAAKKHKKKHCRKKRKKRR